MPQYAPKTRQMINVAGIHPPVYAERLFTVAGSVLTLVGKTQYISKGAANGWPSTGWTYPVNLTAPVLSGTATSGNTLSSSTGVWSNAPTSFTYHWTRDAVNIAGATNPNYLLVAGDITHAIVCKVTAINSSGSATANSNALTPASLMADEEQVKEEKPASASHSTQHNKSAVTDF